MSIPTVAFFDLDHTVIRKSTGSSAIQMYRDRGQVRMRDVALGAWFGLMHYLDLADAEAIMEKVLIPYEGRHVDEIHSEMGELFDRYIRHTFFADAITAVQKHKDLGHQVVLLTASSAYATRYVAEHLDVAYIATHAQLRDQRFTTELVRPIPYGEGKVHHARQHLQRVGGHLRDAWFYSDSHSDLPLLRAVGNPVAVNPDFRLARVARREGWSLQRWREIRR